MLDSRFSIRMQDATKWSVIPPNEPLPGRKARKTYPQITQIDADNITNVLGLYLRYLRHLRANVWWVGGPAS
jgi:hypothetical protein